MNFSYQEIWLILGFLFIAIEVMKIPGFGIIFLGLGGLTVALIMQTDKYYDIDLYQQAIVFLASTALWFAALWHPLRKYIYNKSKDNYKDMVGSEVTVVEHFTSDTMGKVKWSGTMFNARVEDSSRSDFKKGDKLYIAKVNGNILICHEAKD